VYTLPMLEFVGWVERSETQHHPPGYYN